MESVINLKVRCSVRQKSRRATSYCLIRCCSLISLHCVSTSSICTRSGNSHSCRFKNLTAPAIATIERERISCLSTSCGVFAAYSLCRATSSSRSCGLCRTSLANLNRRVKSRVEADSCICKIGCILRIEQHIQNFVDALAIQRFGSSASCDATNSSS